ncbi:MAG TPA: LemA family protein [Anaerolineales bacterium]|nr:LemA family protein [Anaerolineales bacterium]
MKKGLVILGVLVLILLCMGGLFILTYNNLIALDENVQTQWGNVQSNYQRRADLYATQLPVVVANSAQELAVFKELRKQAEGLRTTLNFSSVPTGVEAQNVAAQIAAFDKAVQSFNVYVADNPDIVSAQLYSDFMVTIEGTENRINVARRDYNEAVRTFRTAVRSFPNNLIAPMVGLSPDMYTYFEAQPGTNIAPTLVFPTHVP